MTSDEIARLEQAIAALEAQRPVLGDAVLQAGLAPMLERLESLRRKSAAGQQRKQATVLFADVSGFTSMSESADAEEVTETINALWRLLDGQILEYGGAIDKHIGDAVMALWGAQTVREDDAERAVRAALAMQQAVAAAGLSINAVPLRLRIGIHTGPVFLSEVGLAGEYTAMGDTVNTSSRLQHLAPLGQVVISGDTYLHVRGVFDVTPLPPAQLAGKAEPLACYLVTGAKRRAFRMETRGLEGIFTRMVGRDADLAGLQAALEDVLRTGQRRLVNVIGDAGIGKSRLLYEFENWLELRPERLRYFKGRASPVMQQLPYALLRDLLANRFGIQESDPVGAVRRKLELGMTEAWPADHGPDTEMRAHFIGQLLGYNLSDSPHLKGALDTAQLRDRALLYLNEFFLATAAALPTLLFLEDIHWADSRSLAVIESLAEAAASHPLLIVCLARPTLFERRPEWQVERPGWDALPLSPLSLNESRQLVAEILQKAEQIPDALRELIVGGAEGNPYYVEELIKMLIEDGVIVKETDHWRIEPERLLKAHVPATLAGILQARLDSLSTLERVTLQQAAVVGRTFWDAALAHLSAAAPGGWEQAMHATLDSLCQRELVFQRKSSTFSGSREYIFKHALLRDVTYESVLKRDRRQYHARVAEWLTHNSGERAGEFTGLIADHLELAGQTEQAAHWLLQAGRRAASQFANAEAVQALNRALHLTPPTLAVERYQIFLARERVYDLLGMRSEQTQDLATLQTLAEAIADDAAAGRRALVALRWSNYAEVTGDYPLAVRSAQTAVEQARLAADPAGEAEGVLLLGRAIWRQGNLVEALAYNYQSLELARACNLKPVQAQALRTIGAIAFHQGDYANVQWPNEQALALYQELGDRRGAGSALNNLGDIARQQGDYPVARDYFEQAIHTSHEIGERWSETIGISNISLVLHCLGQQAAARDYALQALDLALVIGSQSSQSTARTNLAHAQAALGELDAAADSYQQVIQQRTQLGQANLCMEARAGLARVYLARGAAQGALQPALEQVEHILSYLSYGTLDGVDEPFRVYLTCCQVLQAAADPRFAAVLELSHRRLQEQAGRISSPDLQRSFLHNVAAHAEIVRLWEGGRGAARQ